MKIAVIGSECSVATEPTAEISHYYITQLTYSFTVAIALIVPIHSPTLFITHLPYPNTEGKSTGYIHTMTSDDVSKTVCT